MLHRLAAVNMGVIHYVRGRKEEERFPACVLRLILLEYCVCRGGGGGLLAATASGSSEMGRIVNTLIRIVFLK
jgi:hypothetical protein